MPVDFRLFMYSSVGIKGDHTIANIDTSLLGTSVRPALF